MAGIHFIGPNILSYNPPATPGQITAGLVADYNFNDWDGGSGVTDTSGNGYDLTKNGTVNQGTDGSGGKYATFSGAGNYMYRNSVSDFGLSTSTDTYTLEVVYRSDNSNKFGNDRFLAIWTTSFTANYWGYDTQVGGVYTGGINFTWKNNNYVAMDCPVAGTTWQHLVLVFDGSLSGAVQYLNGTSYNVTFNGSVNPWPGSIVVPSGQQLVVGGDGSTSTNGYLATVRWYDAALSSGDVASQYAYWQGIGYSGL